MTTRDLVQSCLNAYTRTENVHKKQSHSTHNNTNQNRFRDTFKQTRVLKTCFVQHVLGNTFLKTCYYMNIRPASLGNMFLKTCYYMNICPASLGKKKFKTCYYMNICPASLGNKFFKTCYYMNICPASLGNKFFKTCYYMNICPASHLQTSPKRFTKATVALFSSSQESPCALVVCGSE